MYRGRYWRRRWNIDACVSFALINPLERLHLTHTPESRVAVVDYRGQTVLSTYVQPSMPVWDYRTATTGIEPEHLAPGSSLILSTKKQNTKISTPNRECIRVQ